MADMTETLVAARLALVGDRSPNVRSHANIPDLLAALAERHRLALDAYWIPTEELATEEGAADGVAGFDGVWLLPGSPYRSEQGALNAARTAREQGIPFLGTCAGFQHAILEFARNACGLDAAGHTENDPGTETAVIVPLSCSLVGHEGAVLVAPDTLAERLLADRRTQERYHCNYGAAPEHLPLLERHGLRFSGRDESGEPRIIELSEHPFFLATLFQPELAPLTGDVHPLIQGFAAAAVAHSRAAATRRAGAAR
jgi:CTP synthase (UTP-ammonia lyase)